MQQVDNYQCQVPHPEGVSWCKSDEPNHSRHFGRGSDGLFLEWPNHDSYASYIPQKFRHARLDPGAEDDSRLIEWAARVASGSAINLIIEGVTGSGKTYTACAALSWLAAEHRIWGMFISVSNLLMQMKREFDHEPEGPPILDQCFRTDVLALDDLGLGRNTEWVAGQIDQIFDGRYARERPTIITTNFTTQEILRVFDERVARRIYEDSLVYDKPGVYRGKGQ